MTSSYKRRSVVEYVYPESWLMVPSLSKSIRPLLDVESIGREVLFIRRFEEKICNLYSSDLIKTPVHLSIGQELLSVCLARFSNNLDRVIGNYRSHALALALSKDRQSIVDELCGLKTGTFGGRAGSMHLGVPERGMMWSSAIVASGIPVAVGIAEAVKRKNEEEALNNIVVCMFGDGAMEEGCFIEAINIAATRKLPILFCCEDNGLAIFTRKAARTVLTSYTRRVEGWGVTTSENSYKNPIGLMNDVIQSIERVKYSRTSLMLTSCYRTMEHVGVNFDREFRYRDSKELNEWSQYDIENNPELWQLKKDFVERVH